MYLIELLEKKNLLNIKINELSNLLETNQDNSLAEELFNLLSAKQDLLMSLNKINNISKLNIGSTEIAVANAVIIRDTMSSKLRVITKLIENPSCKLDVLELQKQRDEIYFEYNILSNAIIKNDFSVNIDYKAES